MVGMTGFEPATSRPPDVRANQAALHPDFCGEFSIGAIQRLQAKA